MYTSYWPLAGAMDKYSVSVRAFIAIDDAYCICVQRILFNLMTKAIWNVHVFPMGCVHEIYVVYKYVSYVTIQRPLGTHRRSACIQ